MFDKLLFLLLILVFSNCKKSGSEELLFDCNFEHNGSVFISSDSFDLLYPIAPNIVSPDTDSIHQFVLGINTVTLDNFIDYNIISFTCQIFNIENELLYSVDSMELMINKFGCVDLIHVWDLKVNGEPFYGKFYFNAELNFDINATAGFEEKYVTSISCVDLLACIENPELCDRADCISGENRMLMECLSEHWGSENFLDCK